MNKYVELSRKLLGELKVRKRRISEFTQPVAVVGLACRFPGGDGLEGFWRLLESGGDAVTEARGKPIGGGMAVYGETRGEGSPAHWGGFVEGVDLFDAEFFRIAPVEARLLDPQQRLLLETSWQALESAAIDPGGLKGSRTGVYAGIASHDYADLMVASGETDSGSVYIATGNTGSTAIGRVAFALGLEGPAVAVDTACSSSLVAVHQAVSGLQRGEADLALAGGVNVLLSPLVTETFRNGGMLSPDGRCKTFDASADGFVRGEGCGVVVLKRLADAEAAGDRIWGVVRGSAVNHDGASAGLTVPNGLAQERVIGDALKQAGVEPSEVDYLEAHGTGTELGDPIEVDAAAAVYGAGRDPAQPLLLGSVKTNIGHLETAAGVAGLIKVLLSMNHGVIPRHLHFRQPNPHVDWDRLPVRVVSEPEAWPRHEGRPARAGVSSFGFSGTNAHVVVEGYGAVAAAGPRHSGEEPVPYLVRGENTAEESGGAGPRHSGESRNPVAGGAGPAVAVGWPEGASEFRPAKGSGGVTGARERRLLALSGRTEEALHALAGRYVEWLEERAELLTPVEGGGEGLSGRELLADMAWTAGVGRSHLGHRAGLTFGEVGELREKLALLAGGSVEVSRVRGRGGAPKVGFLFTGQGSQWAGMGRDLYEGEPVFRAVLDRCEEEVKRLRGESLLEVMFEAGQGPELDHTRWTQPALYALEAGLAALWRSAGVRPAAVLGHSVGEIAAAYAAGVLTLEEGMRLAARRGELMGSLPVDGPRAGSMAAVFGSAGRVEELVAEVNEAVRGGIPGTEGDPPFAGEALSVAGYNGGHVVVSGLTGAVEELVERSRVAGLRAERLRVSHGFHSGLMEPVLDELAGLLEGVEARAPEVELVSNVTGAVLGSGERMDGSYWRRQAREPVAFSAGVAALAGLGVEVLVELGPGPVLGRMAALAWPAEGRGQGDEASSGPGSRSPVVVTSLSGRMAGGGTAGRDAGFPEAVAEVYSAGVDLSFAGLFAGEERRRVSLPGYPFQRQRYWAEPPRRRRRVGEANHPLLGERRDSAGGETTFETELYASEPEWLRDHRVFGQVAAPGAIYGAMALSAAALAGGTRPVAGGVAVEDMEMHAPLLLPGGNGKGGEPGRAVQVVVSAAGESGRREVKIYSKGDEEEKWTLHAAAQTAGAVEEAMAGEAVDVEGLKEELGADEAAEFYRAVGKMGVELGPSFRTVTGLWTGPGEAVGEVRLREGLANGETGLHPVLLDGCFQVLGAALSAGAMGADEEGEEGDTGEQEAVYLPFGWERLWIRGDLKEGVTCRARVRGGGEKGEAGEVATADLWLYGESGEMVGEVRGLALKRASRGAFLSVGVRTEELLYVPEWREAPYEGEVKGASFLKPPEEAVRGGGSVSEHLEGAGVTVAGVRELQGELERVARGYAARALEELGWRREAGEEVSEDELRERLGVVKDQEHLFGRVLWLAAEAGLLERVEGERGRWRVPAGSSGEMGEEGLRDPGGLASRLVERHGRVVEVEAGLLSRCGGSLAEVLQGRTEPLGLLFAEGDSGAAELYGEAPVSRAMSDLLAGVLGSAVSGLPEGRVLRVLEVGAGTGGTTRAVLERLPAGEFEYEYTDVSAWFFAGARERFEEWGEAMEYRVLDLEGEPGEQGFEEHGYDVVLAGNVLHATRDIVATLRRCQWLLAPGGLLVAQEGLRRQGLWDLTFGMLAGWWRFVEGGDGYREESPLMGGDEWRGALREAGYEDVAVVGEAEGLDYGVIVARSPEEAAETGGVWVLSSDAGVEGLELAKELSERKQRVLLAVDEKWGQEGEADAAGVEVFRLEQRSRESWRSLLEGVVGEGGGVRGVVHVGGMSGQGEGAGSEEMAADVRESLGSGLALVQGLLDAGVEPGDGLWLVTRGGQVLGGEGGGELIGSVMWGFGRTLWWEAGQLRARLVDLDPAEPGSGFGVLADELLNPDREREIAYRGGVRQVLRLARVGRAGKAAGEGGLLRGDGTYLVTGGMGGIGLEVAGWLADHGARSMVLNGRREPEGAAMVAVEALRERGVDVRVELADVADGDAVAAMVERMDRELPPLAGVFHSVGVLADGALGNQDWGRFERVLWPKVLGAWHLHRATEARELDLFVLFSSVTGVLGNAGQANHAAANAFLDQLARHRRALGLAGQSIAWGAWSGVGEAEEQRERIGERLAASGAGWMTPRQGLGVLERVVRGGEATSVATMMDWESYGAGPRDVPPLLEELVTVSGVGEGASRAGELLDRVREAAASEREGLLLEFVQGELQEVLQTRSLPAAGVGFFDLGMDSLMAVDFRNRLNRGLGGAVVLSSTVVFDHGSAAALARHLAEELGVREVSEGVLRRRRVVGGGEDGIAVVGMACRFPGGGGVDGFWRLLDSGGDAVTNGRVNPPGGPYGVVASGDGPSIRWGGFIEDVELFDAEFFRIAPVEARLLDPQQRLLLETSWEALESAGIDAGRLRGSPTGVYAGISNNDYAEVVTREDAVSPYMVTGNSGATAIGRVAFTLGLEGPAVAVDTVCSSALVAVHQAVLGLQRGDADLALAGGVNVLLSATVTESVVRAGMLSPDGRCKTFDASADGFVRGEGCGMVVLKRLRDAEADGDRIWGVIRGSAINHDGASAGLTVPNGSAQERVIREALRRAGLESWEVDYLEAHGTGTELGDPIEIHAAAAVYGAGRDGAQPLRVGSVKTNVGHLEAAAGVAGLMKVLLSMNHGVIPKHLHFREPNPHVDWERLPLRVASEPEVWPRREGRPARAAVSSFGVSGTNAHVVVEGYGDAAGPEEDRLPGGPAVAVGWPEGASEYRPAEGAGGVTGARERRLLPLSGHTEKALRALAARYAEWLEERAGLSSSADTDGGDSGPAGADPLADVAWTAAVGRSHHGRRAAVTFGGAEELREKLAGLAAGGSASEAAVGARAVGESGEVRKVAFLFTGQGSQWAGMGRELYRREPVFCAVLDRCEEAFRGLRGESLLAVMFGEGGDRGSLDDTRWTQPALYALEAGLAALWGSVGVRPAAVLGHSVGEIAAAYAAGVFSLEAGMRFAARRGELMGSLPAAGPDAGAMAAVFAPAAGVEALVAAVNVEMGSERLGMAAYNGAHQVVSGLAGAVEAMLERCAREGVRAERLRVSQGFHSVLMDPILDELEGLLAGVDVTGPAVALVSDVTGGVLPAGEAMDGAYWRRQAREPVAFGAGVAALAGMGVDVLVELGPRPVLGGMAALAWPVEEGGGNVSGEPGARFGGPVVLTSLKGRGGGGGDGSSDGGFVEAVGGAYASGLALGFEGLFVGEERRRVSLPGYPFQRQRYWADAPRRRRRAGGLEHPLLGERRELPGGETTFETELYATEPAWLSEHRVFGQVAAPGAMYGAMALSAASLTGGSRYGSVTGGGVAVEEVQIHAPLVLPEGEGDGDEPGRTVFVAVAAMEAGGSRPVKIYSKGEDEKEWTLHAEARTGGGDAVRQAPARLDVEALKKGLSELDTAEFYRGFAAAGVEFGGSFRTVQGLWRGPGEAVGDVCLGEGWKDGEAGLHPVLLDGCFQVLGAALGAGAEEEGRGTAAGGATYLPFGWERLWVEGEMPERVTCHARVCGVDGGGDGGDEGKGSPAEVVTADLCLYGDDGRLVGEVSGLVLKRASRSAFLSGAVRTEDLLYAPVWRKAGLEGEVREADFLVSPAEAEEESGLWVLSSDDDGEGLSLAEELAGRNQRVVLAVGEGAAGVEGPGVRGVEVVGLDMRSRGGWHRLLEGLPEEARLRGVVHLGALSGHGSGAGSAELAADVERGTGSALALAQGLVDAGIEPSGGMWLVTRGAQVVDGERGGELSGSALWGLGKTLALEAGQLKPRLVDLDPEDETGSGVLVEELLHPDRETEVAYRGGSRRVLRLVRGGTRLVLPEGADWRLVSGADGLLESVRAERVPARALGSGELRVAVEAAGLNFRDVMVALRLVDLDASLGGEFCGRVLEVGAEVTGFSAGDRVVGFAPGGLGPEAVTRAEVVARAPAGMTPAELATVPVVFTTVALAFELSGLKGGERVLVHAGAGGVGLAAIQMAQSLGAEVYATASAPKRRYLESLGVAEVFDSRSTRFGEEVLGATGGEGVDVVLNSLTGEGFIEASLWCLKEGGRFVEIGKRGIWSEEGMRKARPDVDYHVLALDRLLEAEPGRVGRVLRGVTERVGAAELQPLRRSVWGMGEAVEAMEYMSSGRHVGKLVLRVSSGGLREDGTYLVTGGLGGIGLELAGWLADHGARSMVLNGRREPEGAAMAAVEALRERGVDVRVELADVADGDAVAAMVERMDRELPPLAGVFHSVGVLADGALGNQDWGRFERVLWPKVLGAWHLHRATEARELDLFVLFSSVTGVLGNAGQANHAAANAFLDQLARHRRALGLAGQSIAWGAWSGVGEAEEQRERIGERLAASGAGWMTPRQGLGVLERVVRGGEATSVATMMDWESYGAGPRDVPPLLEELVTVSGVGEGASRAGELLDRVREAAASEREGLLLEFVQGELQEVLQTRSLPAAGVGFFDLGMDSLMAVDFRNRLNRGLGGAVVLSSTVVFDHGSAAALARHLAEELGVREVSEGVLRRRRVVGGGEDGIAVVGMACRFPGGGGVDGFWRLLDSGGDAVTNGRGTQAGGGRTGQVLEGSWTGWGGFIEDVELFDAEFFRIAPVEARLLDPQHRLLLETSWEALESAGMDTGRLKGSRTGVYAGISGNAYGSLAAVVKEESANLYLATGNSGATAIGRVAFTLGLEGPAVAVDTACSASLVAVHQAVSGLRTGDADLALAGGVNVLLSLGAEEFSVEGMLSPDGRCKTFDASADGFVRGEGCGMVVLKRLRDAEADGDRIWGVIRGSAINHDGASAGLTVPNGSAQERVIREALRRAGLESWEVDYLEAHGTGTELGDPIEIHAAAAVYGAGRDGAQPLRVGSVKTNVGHLEAAAGVAGLMKVLLSMNHGVIPKHLHFREPNPHMDWERLLVRVASEPEAWPRREGRPARAAVSSFGISGTNAHVVLEEYGEAAGPEEDRLPGGPAVTVGWPEGTDEGRPEANGGMGTAERARRVLALSGRTEGAVRELAGRYVEWLEERAGLLSPVDAECERGASSGRELLADMAWTAGVGRSHHGCRAGLTFGEAGELREKLAGLASGSDAGPGVSTARETGGAPKVGFLFTGQGSQWAGMGRDLYEGEAVFRAVLDRCEEEVKRLRGESLLAVMFGEGGDRGSLDDTRWTQPALYALEAGLAALWGSVGVRPAAVLGHSVGEIAAAYAAGVFSLEAGMRFAARRGELMGSLPDAGPAAGAMAAVFAPAAGVEALVAVVNGEMGSERLGMAAYNGAHQVVSGRAGAVEEMLERCAREGVRAERLRVSHGFHSVLMDPILEELEGLLAGVDVTAPAVALVSDVTGGVLPAGEAMDGAYWRRQAREPVAFGAGVAALAGMGVDVLVELGPRPVLGGMAALAWPVEEGGGNVSGEPGARFGGPVVLTSLKGRAGGDGDGSSDGGFVEAVGGAYASGLALGFEGLFVGEERRRVSLPGYPFQRQRYWADAPRRRRRAGGLDHPLLGERRELPGGETTFETELYATEPAWLSDHRVFGQVAAPGAMYGAMALSAASLAGGSRYGSVTSGGVAVEEVQIHAPLVLPEGEGDGDEPGRTVFVAVAAMEAAGSRPVKIYSKGEDEKAWTLHAEARTGGGDAVRQAPARLDVEALKKGLSELDTAEFYRGFAAAGVELGGSFRTVQGLWRGPGEAVGDVCLGEGWKDGEAGLHPVLLDGCFQVLGAALGAGAEEEGRETAAGGATYLPFGWERLWVVGEMPERVTCHARVCGVEAGGDGGDEGEGSPAEVVTADLWLYGDDGRLVGEVSGLVLKRASRSAFSSGAVRTEDLLYAPVWRKAGFEGKVREADFPVSPAEVEEESGLWVLSSDDDGEGSALAEELAGRNQRVVLAVGEGAAGVEGPGVRGVEVVGLDMRCRGGWHRLLEGLPEEARLRGVVHLGALSGHGSGAGSAELAADVERGTGSALALAQGLVDAGIEPSGGMWLVTRGAQVVDGERAGELSGSALWGLGKTLALEAGQLKPRLVDLDPEDETGSGVLVEELLHPDRETEVAYRGGSRRVLRLVRAGTRLVLPEGADWRLVSGADGLLESVRAERVPARAPGSGELRVAVEAAGLNFRDVMMALKLVDVDASLGGEFCGRVLDVGADVTGFSAGDRVVGFAPGGLGPEAVTRAEVVARAPAGMTPAELATVPVVFTTVALAFELSGLKGGERVLVHAGAGGVGLAAIQMAQSLGAEVYATASAPKRRYLESLGVAEVFDSRSTRFGEDVLGATGGEGVDVVLNSLTGEGFIEASLSCLKEGGRFVEIGKRGIWSEEGMRKARPDVDYHVLALDRLLEAEPGRVGRVLRGVTERVGAAELQPLRRSVWGMGEAVEAMEYMSSGRHVGKLVLRVSSGGLREDGTYLVTGGLGGIGLELAGWLADHGARSMVLNGRREPEGAAMAAVEALRERGVDVRVELADVADGDAVAAMLERMDRELPPLAGVFHSVGALADGALGNQDWGRFERVLWPKVLGAWHLHRATEARELDLFVLFSSVTGVLGNAGQANHAAANAFLDQLARHRRALGLAGQSIAWGAWSGVGEAEEQRERIGERLAASGAGWMTPRQGLGVLERVVRGGEATSAAMLVDWELYGAGPRDVPPLLEELVTVAAAGVGEEERRGALLERLRGVRAPEREGLLLEFLQRELQAVLHMPSLPAAGVGFFDLGMDSLMAVEFRNRVNRGLAGVTALASTAVFDHASPEALARHLVRELGVHDGPGSFSAEEDASSVSDLETERVQGLSEQEFLKEASRVLGEDHE